VNQRLRAALASRGVSVEGLARHVGVTTKTAQRWVTGGRIPHPQHRWAAARLLGEDEAYLWPESVNPNRLPVAGDTELITLYRSRADIPVELWWKLFSEAERHIDVLVYAGSFLPEQFPNLVDLLRTKGHQGCAVRIALGDPAHPMVKARGVEEGYEPLWMTARVDLALLHYQPLQMSPGVEIRLHGTPLYCSIYRFDDQMLANCHLYGCPAARAPVLHLRRLDGSVFDTFSRSFERVWEQAKPYRPDGSDEHALRSPKGPDSMPLLHEAGQGGEGSS
jgi:transcriptional regulator with XRE-family HTH domain